MILSLNLLAQAAERAQKDNLAILNEEEEELTRTLQIKATSINWASRGITCDIATAEELAMHYPKTCTIVEVPEAPKKKDANEGEVGAEAPPAKRAKRDANEREDSTEEPPAKKVKQAVSLDNGAVDPVDAPPSNQLAVQS